MVSTRFEATGTILDGVTVPSGDIMSVLMSPSPRARKYPVGRCRLNPVEARFRRDWFQCSKVTSDEPLSNSACNFNLRRYALAVSYRQLYADAEVMVAEAGNSSDTSTLLIYERA